MKRLIIILGLCIISITGFGRERNDTQWYDTHYGPIANFIGLWWQYLYPDPAEDHSGIIVEYFSKELINSIDAIPKEWKKRLYSVNIISTTGEDCTKRSYELFRARIIEMSRQINLLIQQGCNIQTPMRGVIENYTHPYHIEVYYAKGQKPFIDQILIIRHSETLFEPTFIVELKGQLTADDFLPLMSIKFEKQ